MDSSPKYIINKSTLDKMGESIRRKYNFTDLIPPQDMPLYIGNDSDEFFITHYNQQAEGGGVVFTDESKLMLNPSHYYAKFTPSDKLPGSYSIQNIWNYLDVEYRSMRHFDVGLQLLSRGKSYVATKSDYKTMDGAAFVDTTGKLLTNGQSTSLQQPHLPTGGYVAWDADPACVVTLDLDSVHNVGKFVMHGAKGFWGIKHPYGLKISLSCDGESFVTVVDKLISTDEVKYEGKVVSAYEQEQFQNGELYSVTIVTPELYPARYVKFEVMYSVPDKYEHVWVSEIEVYGDTTDHYEGYSAKISGTDSAQTNGTLTKFTSLATYNQHKVDNDFAMLLRRRSANCPHCANLLVWDGNVYRCSTSTCSAHVNGVEGKWDIIGTNAASDANISNAYQSGDVILSSLGLADDLDLSNISSTTGFVVMTNGVADLVLNVGQQLHISPTIEPGQFVYDVSYGKLDIHLRLLSSVSNVVNTESSAAASMLAKTKNWSIGNVAVIEGLNFETYAIPTTTPQYNYYDENFRCNARYDMFEHSKIIIDGRLADSGWVVGGWLSITGSNGTYLQQPSVLSSLDYRYKIEMDDEYLYVGFATSRKIVASGSNEPIVRIWIRTNPEASVYTHLYGVRFTANGPVGDAKINQSLTTNSAANISDSSIEFAVTEDENTTCVEFRVKLAEFNGQTSFEYFMCHSNVVNDEFITLYAAELDIPIGVDRSQYFPYKSWITESATHVDTEPTLNNDEIIEILSELF